MASEIEKLQNQILGLEGEMLAVQAVIINVFDAMIKSGAIPRKVMEDGLSTADSIAEGTALMIGEQGHPIHTTQFLRVMEYLRAQILGE